MKEKSIIIIGAGFAGLSVGIYAQMNGYKTQIFEMHRLPGGLCTAWKRRGYIIDGCVHWLFGSNPEDAMNRYWMEVGIAQNREFINADELMRYEGGDGRTFIIYSNVDRLKKHMLELSPQDAKATREFTKGIRLGIAFSNQPAKSDPIIKRLVKGIKFGLMMISRGRHIQKLINTTAKDFSARFKDALIRETLREIWFPEFSLFFLLLTLAGLHNKNAGYPIGGSLPMSLALAKRYRDLGGEIHYNSRVEKIIVVDNRAIGIRLFDGSEHRAGRVVSAADGNTTIFKMLDGKYAEEKTREPYEKWPLFTPLIFIGLGINRTFDDEPKTVAGFSFALREPTEIGEAIRNRLSVHFFNQDPTLAPKGKTIAVVRIRSNYQYWKELWKNKAAYDEKKSQIAQTVVELLDQRFPGISNQVEMVDVATPLTFEHYTGNWQGSYEGWLITPQNAADKIKPKRQTLPGLQNFKMCGQWTEPGGGLPGGVLSGRRLVQSLCKEDGNKFQTKIA
jgi:phytoene dehydrogenase-like protein